jgi:uncharacterized protein (DUF885 family)
MRLSSCKTPFLSLVFVAAWISGAASTQQRTIDDFFREFTTEWVRGNPNQATSSRYFTGDEQDRLERILTPLNDAYAVTRIELARKGLAQLRSFERSRLDDVQRLSADILEWQLEDLVRFEPYRDIVFPFEQFGGVNVNLPAALTVAHPIATEKDADNYVAKLRQVDDRMDEALVDARRLSATGMIPPRFILQATITQMRQFISTPPQGNPFVTSLAERLAAVEVPPARRESLATDARRIVGTDIYPAWERATAFLESLVARASDDAGLWRFKHGPQAYAYALRRFTTTTLTADEIHQIGLRLVTEIEQEMDALLRRLGRTEGTINQRIGQLKMDQAYPLTEEGRTLIMADVEQFMRDAERRAAVDFERQPRAPVIARPFPRFREANAAASYSQPAPDGSRPGTFQIPLRPDRMTKFGLRSLVYHETVPGHHFQIALEMENRALPRFRQIRAFGGFAALSEGWGLYAERFAAESGWYDDDPAGRLGQLDGALFRARRLVVDTGLHAKRWTRQQAIDYGIAVSEVERYVVNPGQACAYMIGLLKIVELREKARNALGNRFSLKNFHTAVLDSGSVPLEILERQIDKYISSAAAR